MNSTIITAVYFSTGISWREVLVSELRNCQRAPRTRTGNYTRSFPLRTMYVTVKLHQVLLTTHHAAVTSSVLTVVSQRTSWHERTRPRGARLRWPSPQVKIFRQLDITKHPYWTKYSSSSSSSLFAWHNNIHKHKRNKPNESCKHGPQRS